MLNIKLSTDSPDWPLTRQIPDVKNEWNDCKFWVNSDIDECDWWFVYEGLTRPETVNCDPTHIVFITGEPPITRTYDPQFLSQFASVITSHKDLTHQNIIQTQQALPWHIGVDRGAEGIINKFLDYDDLSQISSQSLSKPKLASVISSNKKYTRGHRRRIRFIEQLLDRLGDQVDFYGRGFRDIDDKWDAIAPYKYHIVLENSSVPHYFTEKLSDSFLGWSYPIYYGCSNIFNYFPASSLTKIDIQNPNQAIETIETIITSDIFDSSLSYIEHARKLVLDYYNLFALMSEYSRYFSKKEKTQIKLMPEGYNRKLGSRAKKIFRKTKHYGIKKMLDVFLERYY